MRQVVQNILDNAVKYTDSGWINITVSPDGGNALIIFANSGRGIASEFLPLLFTQLHRDETTAKSIEGTGLGLYIARQIVDAHKGNIRAESPGEGERKGSTFYISLPLAQ